METSVGEAPSNDAVSETTTTTTKPRPWQSYHTVYTNAKAGMEGVDKEKVQRIVYEMSKGSKYFENEEKKEAYMKQKIETMRSQCEKLTDSQLATCQMIADKKISELEATRDLSKIWLHVDMDAFYASVETICDPSLKGKPMAVGGMSMISTANYEARRFGVRAAMPGFIARRLCPELIFVSVDFKKYTYYSELTRKVFQKYDPNYTATSLDEAYLDITKVCQERGLPGASIAEELRIAVFEEAGLTCSAGVAPNRLLAKVCSDINKPNGQFVLPNDRRAVMTFISSLPIRKIGGIGKVTEHILRDAIGIHTCEDMLQKGGHICALFSGSTAEFFLSVGLGLGRTDHPKAQLRKSISNERTFSATSDEVFLYQKLAELAELLCADMQKEGLHGRTLTLKLKNASFEVKTRALTLQKYICSKDEIYQYGSKLLKAELPNSLRLMGLRMSQFKEEFGGLSDPSQKTLKSFMHEDSSSKIMRDETCLGSENSDQVLEDEIKGVMSICKSGLVVLSEPHDPSESPSISEQSSHWGFIGMEDGSPSNEKVTGLEERSFLATIRPCENLACSLMEGIDQTARESTSNQPEQVLWIADYKCSLCGVELPSCFIEERQEHADFHLAEKLQKEETAGSSAELLATQRKIPRMDSPERRNSKSKKQKKSSDGGVYLPINMFFTKR
ncbi:hypothetical protein MLD38_019616 [Melastoma candidum]|uniref:Uncharacterized protein n=1 Tax=Melastoma candidum TaxID=119954 RepID=A0ACB9R1L4_9MYRT|nr:hypothetical protein MLD38_019616 [Melastoma candidum]